MKTKVFPLLENISSFDLFYNEQQNSRVSKLRKISTGYKGFRPRLMEVEEYLSSRRMNRIVTLDIQKYIAEAKNEEIQISEEFKKTIKSGNLLNEIIVNYKEPLASKSMWK